MLAMEVGIGRSMRFTYRNGAFIDAHRTDNDDKGEVQDASIPLQRWMKLGELTDHVKAQIKEIYSGNCVDTKFHLGGLQFITISSRYRNIQIRQYATPAKGGKMFPTTLGVSMSIEEYTYFV